MAKKSTKRALVLSIVSIFMTLAMLAGTTLAWFTDSVTSAGNIIKTGTLDVTFEYAVEDSFADAAIADSEWLDASEGSIFTYTNWEPGYVSVKYVKIENVGTLDFKFTLSIIPSEMDVLELAEVIEVYMLSGTVAVDRMALTTDADAYVGTLAQLINETDGAAHGVLYADDADKAGNVLETYTLALKMSDDAGNEYQNKTVGGSFALQLLATQLTSESDDLGNDYDENAAYPSLSAPVKLPTQGESATDEILSAADGALEIEASADFLNSLAEKLDNVTSIAFYTDGIEYDTENKTVTIKKAEIVDQNGNPIDLEAIGNDVPVGTKLLLGDVFANGDVVIVYHDGEAIASGTVENNKIEYAPVHYCEIVIKKAVAKVGNQLFDNAEAAILAAGEAGSVEIIANVTLTKDVKLAALTVADGATLKLNGIVFEVAALANGEAVEVYGETTLKIETLTGSSIDLCEGAIVKDSTVGGAGYVAGNVLFRGDNTFTMLTDYGDYYSSVTPSKWAVEKGGSLTLTKNDRYGLGYGDVVFVEGTIENALDARETLTDADASINMYGGLVGMTNSAAPNAQNKFTAKDAYLIFGVQGDKSFGTKYGNYYGNYTFEITNCVMTANGFKFYEDKGNTTLVFKNTDLLVGGVLMTNDVSSTFTFTNCTVLSEATSNGSDDKNQNAGVLTLENTEFTYSAKFTNVGTVEIDLDSVLTAPEIAGNGKIVVDATGFEGEAIQLIKGNMSGYTGTIEVTGAAYEMTAEGLFIVASN